VAEHVEHLRECAKTGLGEFWPAEVPDADGSLLCSCGQDFVVPGEHWHDHRGKCHMTDKCEQALPPPNSGGAEYE
jgi:hypothetical protein